MSNFSTLKITKIFGMPLFYICIGAGVGALIFNVLQPENPVRLSGFLGVVLGFYIVWFITSGRDKIKQFQPDNPSQKSQK